MKKVYFFGPKTYRCHLGWDILLLYTKFSLYECRNSEITNLQTELNYLNLFKIYCIFSDLGPPGSGNGCGGCAHICAHACMCMWLCMWLCTSVAVPHTPTPRPGVPNH